MAIKPNDYVHKELAPSRIKTDIEAVDRVINLCENVFKNPWDEGELISLSTGLEATADIKDSLFKAKEVGLKGSQEFIDTRGSANPELDFFDPLPKSKMKTFKDLKKVVKVNVKDRLIPLRMDRNLFSRMALAGQFRKIDLKTVFTYPLGAMPWSLADAFGLIRKTNKAQLAKMLENNVPIAERYPNNASSIYDGMALLQRLKLTHGPTFRVVAEKVFLTVTSSNSNRTDVVFDVYGDVPIKNAERSKRSSRQEGVRYKNILPSYQVKSWNKFLSVSSNKTEAVKFIVSEWKKPEFTSRLQNRLLFVTLGDECYKLSSTGIEFVSELQSNQEEADTRMILHTKHVQGPFVIHADDTDVLVLLLSHSHTLGAAYMKAGRGSKTRVINIQSIKDQIAKDLPAGVDLQDFLRCLIGMHALTGCDTVSAFANKGKSKALKMLMKNDTYVRAFMNIGIS